MVVKGDYYRSQKKFAKIMFLHLSVSHYVHRGRLSRPMLRVGGGGLPKGAQAWGVSRPRLGVSRPRPGGCPGPGPGVSRPRSRGVQAWGVYVSQHALR